MRFLRNAIGDVFRFFFWLGLVVCGIECTRAEVKNRAYKVDRDLPDENAIEPSDALMSAAAREFAIAETRRGIVDDKARMLLTLVGLLIPVTAALASRLTIPVLVFLPLACFFFSSLMLVGYLGIGSGMKPTVSSKEALLDETKLKRRVIIDILSSARGTEGATNFLVDVYRAALRALLFGLLFVVIISGIAYAPLSDPTADLLDKLRGDPTLIRELRGPQGAPGPQGPVGPQGPAGPPATPERKTTRGKQFNAGSHK